MNQTHLDTPKDSPTLPPLLVRETNTGRGKGVFAVEAIHAGQVVEVSPVIVIPGRFRELPTPLKRYVFNWGNLARTDRSSAIALGFGSLYNHANPANLNYKADTANQAVVFTATRAIGSGEELTINYNASGGSAESHNDNWFERMGVDHIEDTGSGNAASN